LKNMPQQLLLTQIKKEEEFYFITGSTVNQSQVTELLSNFNQSNYFFESKLLEVKKTKLLDGKSQNIFQIKVKFIMGES